MEVWRTRPAADARDFTYKNIHPNEEEAKHLRKQHEINLTNVYFGPSKMINFPEDFMCCFYQLKINIYS